MKRFGLFALSLCVVFSLNAAPQKREVIEIETADKGYYLMVERGNVRQVHFGDKIESSEDLLSLYPAAEGRIFNTKSYLYPTFGVAYVNEVALKLVHADGNLTTRLKYVNHKESRSKDGNVTTTTIKLQDEAYALSVILTYKAYRSENVITSSVEIVNNEKGEVVIEGAASNYLTKNASSYYLTRFFGAWAGEGQMVESELKDGITVIDSKRGIRTTQDGSPSFILSFDNPASETEGEVILGSLAWRGNYKLSFEVDNLNNLNIISGINDFMSEYKLSPKKSFVTPEMVLTHSNNGVGEASRNLHRWVRRYNILDGDMERPVVLNNWEGTKFDFDEDIIKDIIDNAATMGVEMFVLDDGWFGNKYPRDFDSQGLGDWQVNSKKLPNGIKALIDHANKQGLEFGLWVEPESVNPRSEVAEKHPEWIVTSANREPLLQRNQRLLDMTNPEVKEFAYHIVADLLSANPGIKYIKWDTNRHIDDFGSAYLDSDKQSHFWIDYHNSITEIYERLTKNFPYVVFQSCASGGGRIDYSTMKYHHEVWGSDNTDAESRLFINYGHNQFFPAMSVASHVSHSPNQQTKQDASIKFRFDVAMSQRLGVELQPAHLTESELSWSKRAVAEYIARIRPVVQLGDQYRLISPYDKSGYVAQIYVSEDKSRAVYFAYSLKFHNGGGFPTVKLQGLDPNKRYMIKEIMPAVDPVSGKEISGFSGVGQVYSGDALMKYGVRTLIKNRQDSAVLELVAVE